MSIRDVITSKVIEAGGRLTVRSALNPILWLCAIITVPALVLCLFRPHCPVWLIILAWAPVGTAVFGFIFLLAFDRDKLQSEDFQLRKRSLELIEQKGDLTALDASVVEVIANPEVAQLPPGEQGGDA